MGEHDLAMAAELTEKDAEIERLREEVTSLERRRGGECDTCGGWVCPPLRCVGCMLRARVTPEANPGPLAADAIRKQDAELTRLRAELAKAQATIDARPVVGKTADGVEVRIGDPVWMLDEELVWYVEPGGTIGCHTAVSYSWPVTLAYSTREAAKAAEG